MRYKRDIFNFQSAILRKTSFPKERSSKRKEPAKGNNHREQPREHDVSHLEAKAGRRFSGYLPVFCAPCFPVYIQMAIVLSICAICAFLMTIIYRKRVDNMLITNASR
uniref:Testis-expressed sequence 29 protein n=1 Tax=Siphoviridae sp. ctkhg5 TaxID=2825643 RepID=A0A8S5UDI0_9CAUD|nr:MAG TPA: Testis-expressed sequence 29 protein [Siphoviridae sp. ctkhg5]